MSTLNLTQSISVSTNVTSNSNFMPLDKGLYSIFGPNLVLYDAGRGKSARRTVNYKQAVIFSCFSYKKTPVKHDCVLLYSPFPHNFKHVVPYPLPILYINLIYMSTPTWMVCCLASGELQHMQWTSVLTHVCSERESS